MIVGMPRREPLFFYEYCRGKAHVVMGLSCPFQGLFVLSDKQPPLLELVWGFEK